MKISLNWLKTYIKTDLPAEEIARILSAFTEMQEKGMGIPSHTLRFLMRKI